MPQVFRAPPSTLMGIPDGVAGVKATLRQMSRLVKAYKIDPRINLLALDITRGLPSYDQAGEIRRLQNWVRDKIRYVADIDGYETIRTPLVTLEYEAGDCDDKSTLLATLLATVGYSVQFIAVGFDGGDFSHVLCAVKMGTRVIACETIQPGVEPGWFPPDTTCVLPWNV